MGVRLSVAYNVITAPYRGKAEELLRQAKQYFAENPRQPLVVLKLPNKSKKFMVALKLIASEKEWDYIAERLFLSISKVVIYQDKEYYEMLYSHNKPP